MAPIPICDMALLTELHRRTDIKSAIITSIDTDICICAVADTVQAPNKVMHSSNSESHIHTFIYVCVELTKQYTLRTEQDDKHS